MYNGRTLYYMAPFHNSPLIAILGVWSYNKIQSNPVMRDYSWSIADREVNARRHSLMIQGKSLHDYVPLYWTTHTPMQYVTTISERRLPQDDLVFFLFDANEILSIPNVLTTDGNAASVATTFYRGAWGVAFLDVSILRTRNCYSPEYKRKKAAEVLVPDEIPADYIRDIVVRSHETQVRLQQSIADLRDACTCLPSMTAGIRVDVRLYY